MPKIVVCKSCGCQMQAKYAGTDRPACTSCIGISKDASMPVEMDVPDKLICHCRGSVAEWNEEKGCWILTSLNPRGGWNATYDGNREIPLDQLPFLDCKEASFYCGHLGWD